MDNFRSYIIQDAIVDITIGYILVTGIACLEDMLGCSTGFMFDRIAPEKEI